MMLKKLLSALLVTALLMGGAATAFAEEETQTPAPSESAQPSESTDPSQSQAPNASEEPTQTPSDTVQPLAADKVTAEAALLIDATTQKVLYEKNADTKMYPASTTKILTALVALKHGNLDDTCTVTNEALMAVEPDAKKMGFLEDEKVTLRDLLYSLLMQSDADAATTIAVHVGGSVEKFVEMMNQECEALGLKNSHFTNPVGMHNENLYTTCNDLAKIVLEARKYEEFMTIVSTYKYTISPTNKNENGYTLVNANRLVSADTTDPYRYEYCTGGKTGYTEAAQHTLVEMAQRDKGEGNMQDLIAIVFKDTKDGKWSSCINMLNYGFTNYSTVNLTQLLSRKTVEVEVDGAAPDDALAGKLELGIPSTDQNAQIVTEPQGKVQSILTGIDKLKIDYKLDTEPLTAPVAEGEKVGTVTYTLDGEVLLKSDLVAMRSVKAEKSLVVPGDTQEDEKEQRPLMWWIWLIPIALLVPIVAVVTIRRRRRLRRRRSSKYYTYRRRL